jgi:hypothetical protein
VASDVRIAGLCLLVLTLAAAVLVTAPAAARSKRACREQVCVARFTVSPQMSWFESDEVFRPGSERVSVHLSVGGEQLSELKRTGTGGCRRRLSGAGVRAVVHVCGARSPVSIRAYRVWGGWVDLDVSYRGIRRASIPQGVEGVHAGSGHAAGATGAPGSGGVAAP